MIPRFKNVLKIDIWAMMETVVILLGILLIGGPILTLMIKGMFYGLSSAFNIESIVPSQRVVELLIRSIALASLSGVATVGLGFFIALFIWRFYAYAIKFVLGFLMLLFLIPSFVHAQSWIFFMDWVNGYLGYNFTGFYASLWVFVMTYLPCSIGFSLVGLYGIDPDLIDTGELYSSTLDTLKSVLMPLCSPFLMVSFNLIFVLCLTDFGIPSLFAINVYPLHIFSEFSTDQSVGHAFLAALPLLFITAIVVFSSFSVIARLRFDYTVVEANSRAKKRQFSSWASKVVLFCAAMVWGFQIAVPLGSLLMESKDYAVLTNSLDVLSNSLIIASAAALICLTIGFVIGNSMVEQDKTLKWWWVFLSMVFIMPAPLVGIGLIAFWQHLPLGLYGTIGMPIMAAVIRFLPIVVLVSYVQLKTLDQEIMDATTVFMTNKWTRYWYVLLPMCKKGIIISLGMAFALTLGELGATLMVTPPGVNTLIMKLYNYLHFGASNTVATLCLLLLGMIVIMGCVIGTILALMDKLNRNGR